MKLIYLIKHLKIIIAKQLKNFHYISFHFTSNFSFIISLVSNFYYPLAIQVIPKQFKSLLFIICIELLLFHYTTKGTKHNSLNYRQSLNSSFSKIFEYNVYKNFVIVYFNTGTVLIYLTNHLFSYCHDCFLS